MSLSVHFESNVGKETLSALIPTLTNTTAIALSRFEPDVRKCFQDQEFLFNYLKWSNGFRYSNKNCLYEAVIEKIISECDCLPSFAMERNSGNYFSLYSYDQCNET